MSLKTSTRRAALALLAGLFAAAAAPAPPAVKLRVEPLEVVSATGVAKFQVEMADTPASRERGLMFRKALAPDRGMLFDFKTPQETAFWMRNTLIPLDILFVARDGRIITIARNAAPLDETPIPSGGPVLGVLELKGGRAAELGLSPGDRVRQRIFTGG